MHIDFTVRRIGQYRGIVASHCQLVMQYEFSLQLSLMVFSTIDRHAHPYAKQTEHQWILIKYP